MSRPLSNAAKQAMFAQQTKEAFVVLLTISHPNFTDDIRVASDDAVELPIAGVRGVISRGEEYLFLPFSIEMPVQDPTNIARASISVDNVGREMIDGIRSANSAVDVKIEVILASDPDEVEIEVPDFKLQRVQYDALTVTGDISVEYFDLEPFPKARFTPSQFPGIF